LAEEKIGDRDPATTSEAASDDEPVPMSIDRDAEDRTLDRQLAYPAKGRRHAGRSGCNRLMLRPQRGA
jgi:hypothetical protein